MYLFHIRNIFKRSQLPVFMAIAFLVLAHDLFSQDLEGEFEDFQKSIYKDFQDFQDSNDRILSDFVDSINLEFYNMLKEADEEFASMLGKDWKEYELFQDKYTRGDKEPDFQIPYQQEPVLNTHLGNYQNYELKVRKERSISSNLFYKNEYQSNLVDLSFDFYQNPLQLQYHESLSEINLKSLDKSDISVFWRALSSKPYQLVLVGFEDIKDRLSLNDWAFVNLVAQASSEIVGGKENEKVALTWFLLRKSGYDVKIGHDGLKLYILYHSKSRVYDVPRFTELGKDYYVFNGRPKTIFSYKHTDNKGAEVSLYFDRPLLLEGKKEKVRLDFKFKGKNQEIEFYINKSIIDFYNNYPQVNLDVYAQSFLSEVTTESLLAAINKSIAEYSLEEKIEFLLSLTQSSKTYKSDSVVYGKERYMFPEESLFYESSDCEDRSILLAKLIKDILNLNSIGIEYTGHVILGIPSEELNLNGVQLIFNNANYILADPSYRDAPLGIITPDLLDDTPKVFSLYAETSEQLVGLENIDGFFINHTVKAHNGSVFFTGLLYDTVKLKGKSNQITYGSPISIVGNYFNDSIKILLQTESMGKCSYQQLLVDKKGNVFVSGYYSGVGQFSGQQLVSDSISFFVLKINAANQVEWITDFKVADNISSESFSLLMDTDGKILSVSNRDFSLLSEPESFLFEDQNRLVYSGLINRWVSLGDKQIGLESGDDFDIVDWLIAENKRLVKADYYKSITPVLSILNYLNISNGKISAEILLKSMDKMSFPLEKRINVEIQEKLESVNKVDEFILIKTIEEKKVEIRSIQFQNRSRLKIKNSSDLTRLYAYSGVYLKQAGQKYKVNYLEFDNLTGEFFFDYGQHYRKTIPARQVY